MRFDANEATEEVRFHDKAEVSEQPILATYGVVQTSLPCATPAG
jgi:hypothetical protein